LGVFVKKIFKFLGFALLFVLLAAAGAAAYIHFTGLPHYPVQKIDLKVEVTPERVERGRKIAGMLCAGCHLDTQTGRLTGHKMPDMPAQFGVAYSLNITQHPEKGIGSWTDGEIAFLLRTGIARDGRYTPPWMVKLPRASDEEIASIIAFLRSSDPLVQASDAEDFPSQPTFFTKFLTRVAFKPFPYPTQPIGAPDASADRVARGRHLANNIAGCFACHSADFATNDDLDPEKSKGFYGGGNAMPDMNGQMVRTANITPDKETGIGGWTEDQFVRAVKGGFGPDNRPLVYPMEPYVELTDEEARAIWAYLQTVPAIRNVVERAPRPAAAADASEGEKIYYKYSCHSCHGESGVGRCDLRQELHKYPTDEALITFIRNPAATVPGSKMPAWEGVIEEGEYASLAAHVRTLGVARTAGAGAGANSGGGAGRGLGR
jgi:mono/diheme cytochrome c family protein